MKWNRLGWFERKNTFENLMIYSDIIQEYVKITYSDKGGDHASFNIDISELKQIISKFGYDLTKKKERFDND